MAGTFTFTILATDAANATASKAYTVVINNTLTITAATLANWTVNQTGYSQTVTTSGGTTPLTFALASGSLPNGLSLNVNTGVISGTPAVANPFTFTIKVTDSVGATASQQYTVTINPAIVLVPNGANPTVLTEGTTEQPPTARGITATNGTMPFTNFQVTMSTCRAA